MGAGEDDAESAFRARIDCRFPYDDQAAARALIGEARAISPNACFAVLHEIVAEQSGVPGAPLDARACIDLMRAIGAHPGQYAALGLAYATAASAEADPAELDELHDAIIAGWRANAKPPARRRLRRSP